MAKKTTRKTGKLQQATGSTPGGRTKSSGMRAEPIPGYFADATIVNDPLGREFNIRVQFLSTLGLRTLSDMLGVTMSSDHRITRQRVVQAWASADKGVKSRVAQKALELAF